MPCEDRRSGATVAELLEQSFRRLCVGSGVEHQPLVTELASPVLQFPKDLFGEPTTAMIRIDADALDLCLNVVDAAKSAHRNHDTTDLGYEELAARMEVRGSDIT
jgi:hypothetical protein